MTTRRVQAKTWQAKAEEAARQLKTERDPIRADRLELAVEQWSANAKAARKLTPQDRRVAGTAALCATASALFLAPAAQLGALSPGLALAGIGGPLAVAALWWNVIVPPRMVREADTRTSWRPDVDRADDPEEVSVR